MTDALTWIIACMVMAFIGFYGTLRWAEHETYCTNGTCYVEVHTP